MGYFLSLFKKNYYHIAESFVFGFFSFWLNLRFFADAPFYSGAVLNPFEFFPILMSLRYGYMAGLFDFVIIMGFGVLGCYQMGKLNYLYDKGWIFVIGVMLLSQIAGKISDTFRVQLERLRSEYDLLTKLLNDSVEKNVALTEANKALSKKIVSRFDSMITVYEDAKRLETMELEELFPNSLEILKNNIAVKSGSIYMMEGGKLTLKGAFDLLEKVDRPDTLNMEKGMLKRVFESASQVSYLPYLQGRVDSLPDMSDGDYLCVTPIYEKENIVGVIVVENISFIDFNRTTLKMIEMVAEWIKAALERISKYRALSDEVPDDPELYGYKAKYMKSQLVVEISKAIRYGLPFSALSLRIKDSEKIERETLNNISSVIGCVFKNMKRQIDLFGATTIEGVFLLILPVTDRKGMSMFIERVLREIDSFNFMPYGDSSKRLKLDVFKFSIDDVVDREILKKISKDEIGKITKKVINDAMEILGLEEK